MRGVETVETIHITAKRAMAMQVREKAVVDVTKCHACNNVIT